MPKPKREEKADKEGGDYEFKLPSFDERTFIRREVQGAKASFYTLALGTVCGLASGFLVFTDLDWKMGWLPLLTGLVILRPTLVWAGFPEDVTKPKALVGSYFMCFFTALSVWILTINVL